MLLSILLMSAFWTVPSQSAPGNYDEAEAYEIYALILSSEYRFKNAKQFVIRRETDSYQMCLKPNPEFEERLGPAIAAYVELNKKEWLLQPKLRVDRLYQLVGKDRFKMIFDQGSWEAYYAEYPQSQGFIQFSAVGFNKDQTVAVVYMGYGCCGLCGAGQFYVLEKVNGKWKPFKWEGESCSWIS